MKVKCHTECDIIMVCMKTYQRSDSSLGISSQQRGQKLRVGFTLHRDRGSIPGDENLLKLMMWWGTSVFSVFLMLLVYMWQWNNLLYMFYHSQKEKLGTGRRCWR